MIGLVGLNWFNQNNTVGRDLWAITLAEGGGNPGMKVNPIYVKKDAEEINRSVISETDASLESDSTESEDLNEEASLDDSDVSDEIEYFDSYGEAE